MLSVQDAGIGFICRMWSKCVRTGDCVRPCPSTSCSCALVRSDNNRLHPAHQPCQGDAPTTLPPALSWPRLDRVPTTRWRTRRALTRSRTGHVRPYGPCQLSTDHIDFASITLRPCLEHPGLPRPLPGHRLCPGHHRAFWPPLRPLPSQMLTTPRPHAGHVHHIGHITPNEKAAHQMGELPSLLSEAFASCPEVPGSYFASAAAGRMTT